MTKTLTVDGLARVFSLHSRTVRGAAIGSEMQIAKLVALGVLAPAGVVTSRTCDRCEWHHVAKITATPEGLGWYCPSDGFVLAETADIAAYSVRVDSFIGGLAVQMDRPRLRSKPSRAPSLWSIGTMTASEVSIAIYFTINAGSPQVFNEVLPILASEPRTDCLAVLTNDTRDLSRFILPRHGRIISIVDCVEIKGGTHFILDRDQLVRSVVPDELMQKPKPGRPNNKERLAYELIKDLDADGSLRKMNSMRARCRELAHAAKERCGEATTLSRPSCEAAWSRYSNEQLSMPMKD